MAETHLSDMIIPTVFDNWVQNNSVKTNNFINSGILTPDKDMGDKLMQPGTKMTIPYINDLDGDANNWTDDTDIPVDNLTSGTQLGMKFYQSKAFGETDISRIISGAPIQEQIGSRFSTFWNNCDQQMLLSVLKGAFQVDDIANAKVLDLTVQSPSDAQFSAKGFIAALSLMGDQPENILSGIAVNSTTYGMMKAQNLIDTIQPSNGGTPINVYNGKVVTIDDDIPIEKSGNDSTSIAYLFGTGAVGYSTQMYGTKIVDEPLKQGGREAVVQKRIGCIHPYGISINASFTPTKPNFPTPEDFAKKEAWTMPKDVDVKKVHLVQYKFKLDPFFVLKQKSQNAVKQAREAAEVQDNDQKREENGNN